MKSIKRTLLVVCTMSIILNARAQNNSFSIFHNEPAMAKYGYNNINMKTNGELNVIQNLIKKENLIFDIGANTGEWSNHAVSTHKSISIFAFEPIPSVYNQLSLNGKNWLNFKAFNIALSNAVGTATFVYYQKNSSSAECSGLFQRPLVESIFNVQPTFLMVNTETIDHFCTVQAIDHIDFLKIDTEGAELLVLQGALGLLEKKKISIIQFEYGGTYRDSKITLQEVYRLLTKNRYGLFRIVPDGLIFIDKWHNELENYLYSNYIAACPKETAKLLAIIN